MSLLQLAGLMVVSSWKKPGSTGYAATCCVKVPAASGDLVQLALRNFLRKVFGVPDADNFIAYDEDDIGTAGAVGIRLPPSPSIETMHAFEVKWSAHLNPSIVQSTLQLARRAGAKLSVAMSPRRKASHSDDSGTSELVKKLRTCEGDVGSAAGENAVSKEQILAIKAHFFWIFARTNALEIKKNYIAAKIPGWDKESDHWDVVKSFLSSLGLMREDNKCKSGAHLDECMCFPLSVKQN